MDPSCQPCLPRKAVSTITTPGKVLEKCLSIIYFKSLLPNIFCSGLSLTLRLQLHSPPWTHHVLSSLRALAPAVSPPALLLPLVFHGCLPCLFLQFQLKCFTFRFPVPTPYPIPSFYLSQFVMICLVVYLLTTYLSQRRENVFVSFTSVSPVLSTRKLAGKYCQINNYTSEHEL